MDLRRLLFSTLTLLQILAFSAAARAAEPDAPMLLVATQVLNASAYAKSVVLAVPDGQGQHFGLVLNRPTDVSLAELLPDEPALPRAEARVFAGGPVFGDRLFALARGHRDTTADLIAVAPDLFLAMEAGEIDRVLADRDCEAHFYVGMVIWRPGELAAELRAGAWDVLEPEPNLVLSADPDGQWQQLVTEAHMVRVVDSHARVPRMFGHY